MTEMRTFRLDKLVRDKIVEGHEEIGGSAEHRRLEGDELIASLHAKLDEELAELKDGEEPALEKLADLREVIEAIAVVQGHSLTELHSAQYDKRRKAGGFVTGLYVDQVTVPEGSWLNDYYSSDPLRFPEVMTEQRQATVDTYNARAPELAEHFRSIGPRDKYIDYTLGLIGNPNNPRVVEIGCGDGRDAKSIVERTDDYIGFDISPAMIKLAKEHVPKGSFVVADAAEFEFPRNLDAVFAFASLLHLNQSEIAGVLDKAYQALNPQGVFYISLKHSPEYRYEVQSDRFGDRLFYYYDQDTFKKLAGDKYTFERLRIERMNNLDWLEMALRKK